MTVHGKLDYSSACKNCNWNEKKWMFFFIIKIIFFFTSNQFWKFHIVYDIISIFWKLLKFSNLFFLSKGSLPLFIEYQDLYLVAVNANTEDVNFYMSCIDMNNECDEGSFWYLLLFSDITHSNRWYHAPNQKLNNWYHQLKYVTNITCLNR